jgi:hypothetical protein
MGQSGSEEHSQYQGLHGVEPPISDDELAADRLVLDPKMFVLLVVLQ